MRNLDFTKDSPQSVKLGDSNDVLSLLVTESDNPVDLSNVSSITVKIGNTVGYLTETNVDVSSLQHPTDGIIDVVVNNKISSELPAGQYLIEVWIDDAKGNTVIYPDTSYPTVIGFSIKKNIMTATSTVITTLTLADFETKFDDMQEDFETKFDDMQEDLQYKVASGYFKGDTGTVDNTGLISAPAFQSLQTRVNNITENVYYSGVETTQYYDEQAQTVYYLTKVPAVDETGQAIQIKHGFAFGVPNHQKGSQTPASFLADHPTATLISNAEPFPYGNIIANGKIISSTADGLIDQTTMAVLKDGTLTWYPTKTTSEAMLADGVVNSFTGFWPIIVDGKAFDTASIAGAVSNPNNDWTYLQGQHPRNVICQLADKSLLFLTSEGRLKHNVGLSFDDLIRILLPLNVVFAYNFDGGGSTALINKGVRINAPYDGNFIKERALSTFLYIDKIDGQTSPDPQQQVNYQANLKSIATYNILAHQLLDLEHNSNFDMSGATGTTE